VKLVDTTVAIDHLRGEVRAVELLRRLVQEEDAVAASEVVRFELLAGVRDDELGALEQFCSALRWVAVDESVARTAGALAREYRAAYGGIDDVDYLIAATALLLDAELVTTNVRHFPMLADIEPAY
jgi:predicted nucleic acid-binding protein